MIQGYIDELSVSHRAKTACEILEIATLAANFKFDTPAPTLDSGPNVVTTTTASTTFIAAGHRNDAISFAGTSSSYFQASGFTAFGIDDQPFSISLWVQPQLLTGTLVHLSSTATGTGSHCFPLLGFDSSGALVAQVMTAVGSVVSVTGPILSVSTSTWVHVVQTWSSSNGLKLYVNNTMVSSAAAGSFVTSGTTPNYLTLGDCLSGCSGSCTNGGISTAGPHQGNVDEWRIYIRELSVADVCTLSYYS